MIYEIIWPPTKASEFPPVLSLQSPPLLQVCRFVRLEASPIYFANHILLVDKSSASSSRSASVRLAQLQDHSVAHIRTVHILNKLYGYCYAIRLPMKRLCTEIRHSSGNCYDFCAHFPNTLPYSDYGPNWFAMMHNDKTQTPNACKHSYDVVVYFLTGRPSQRLEHEFNEEFLQPLETKVEEFIKDRPKPCFTAEEVFKLALLCAPDPWVPSAKLLATFQEDRQWLADRVQRNLSSKGMLTRLPVERYSRQRR